MRNILKWHLDKQSSNENRLTWGLIFTLTFHVFHKLIRLWPGVKTVMRLLTRKTPISHWNLILKTKTKGELNSPDTTFNSCSTIFLCFIFSSFALPKTVITNSFFFRRQRKFTIEHHAKKTFCFIHKNESLVPVIPKAKSLPQRI